MSKLASAAYVPPEKIESFLGVWARPQDDFVVSVVVPNFVALVADPRLLTELKEKVAVVVKDPVAGRSAAEEEICCNESVVKIYMDTLAEVGKKNNFPGHWSIRGIILEPVRWTEPAGLLTFTNKLKRRRLVEKYQGKIDELVSKL